MRRQDTSPTFSGTPLRSTDGMIRHIEIRLDDLDSFRLCIAAYILAIVIMMDVRLSAIGMARKTGNQLLVTVFRQIIREDDSEKAAQALHYAIKYAMQGDRVSISAY